MKDMKDDSENIKSHGTEDRQMPRLFSIDFHHIFIGTDTESRSAYLLLIQIFPLLPLGSGCPQSCVSLPWLRSWARAASLWAAPGNGLWNDWAFVGREARRTCCQLIYGAAVVFLLASTPINTRGRLVCLNKQWCEPGAIWNRICNSAAWPAIKRPRVYL